VPHVVVAFSRGEELECHRDQCADVIEGARARGSEKRFQFGEGEFDRVEVGTVGRQKAEVGTDLLDGDADLRLFVHRQVVEHHDVARSQGRHQDLFDVGEETRTVDRAIEDGWRAEAVEPQRGDHRVRLPMATGCVIAEPGAPQTSAVAAQQIGRHAAFIEEDVLAHVAERQPRVPLPSGRDDVRSSLLVRVDGFF